MSYPSPPSGISRIMTMTKSCFCLAELYWIQSQSDANRHQFDCQFPVWVTDLPQMSSRSEVHTLYVWQFVYGSSG